MPLSQPQFGSLKPPRPFRRAVLGGLAVVLPPLLTVAVFVWVGNTINFYVLQPVKGAVKSYLVWQHSSVRDRLPGGAPSADDPTVHESAEGKFKRLPRGQFVPHEDFLEVRGKLSADPTGDEIYELLVEQRYLQPHIVVPVFLCVFVLLLYVLGKFIAAGIGRAMWNLFEQVVVRVPFISNVYASVKQVTDFLLTESDLEYTRVIALEYPCKGVWSLGFVTGEGLLQVSDAAEEPVISVLEPTSPMPVTGFTAMIPKSSAVDLDLTIDQAFQYIISCGVVAPLHQLSELAKQKSPGLLRRGKQLAAPETTAQRSGEGDAPPASDAIA